MTLRQTKKMCNENLPDILETYTFLRRKFDALFTSNSMLVQMCRHQLLERHQALYISDPDCDDEMVCIKQFHCPNKYISLFPCLYFNSNTYSFVQWWHDVCLSLDGVLCLFSFQFPFTCYVQKIPGLRQFLALSPCLCLVISKCVCLFPILSIY